MRKKDSSKKKGQGRVYRFVPVMFDMFNRVDVKPGERVRKVQPYGCPRNGTMGMTYVEDMDGNFRGMVCVNSLKREGKEADDAYEAYMEFMGEKGVA